MENSTSKSNSAQAWGRDSHEQRKGRKLPHKKKKNVLVSEIPRPLASGPARQARQSLPVVSSQLSSALYVALLLAPYYVGHRHASLPLLSSESSAPLSPHFSSCSCLDAPTQGGPLAAYGRDRLLIWVPRSPFGTASAHWLSDPSIAPISYVALGLLADLLDRPCLLRGHEVVQVKAIRAPPLFRIDARL